MKRSSRVIQGIMIALCLAWVIAAVFPSRLQRPFLVLRYWNRQEGISFYGKVTDQRGKPLSGASVLVAVDQLNPGSVVGSENYLKSETIAMKTNADGTFALQNAKGTYLHITRITKQGYIDFPEPGFELYDVLGYGYSRDRGEPYYVPDPQKPAVFPLLKVGERRTSWPSRGGSDEANSWNVPATKKGE